MTDDLDKLDRIGETSISIKQEYEEEEAEDLEIPGNPRPQTITLDNE